VKRQKHHVTILTLMFTYFKAKYLPSSVELCTKLTAVHFARTVRPFVTFEWAESWSNMY